MNIQMNMFDCLEEETLFTKVVKRGSVFAGSKERIRNSLKTCKDVAQLAAFLKKEYGTGGYMRTGLWCNYSPKGMEVGTGPRDLKKYSWNDVAKKIIELEENY